MIDTKLSLKLDKWQEQVLSAQGNVVLRSGRQVGKSTIISIKAARFAISKPRKTILIIAATERQAFLLFEKVLRVMETISPKMIKTGKDKPTKSRLKLKNGSIIYCLPTGLTGYGIRGYTIDLLIADEAAYIPNEVWTAVTPMLAARKNAAMILLSTPHGRKGFFADCFKRDDFVKFHISSEECPRIDKEFLEAEKKRMTKKEYAQEYLGEFIDDLMQFFPDELIKRCMARKRPEAIPKNRNYYLGVDIARMGEDESTFEIVMRTEKNKLIHIENQITTKTLLSQTAAHIINLDKIYNFQKIFIDDEGLGVGVLDILLETEQTRRKVIPINNSKRILDHQKKERRKLLKEDLYNNLLRLMELGEIELLDDPEIFQSLKSVQYEYTTDSLGRPHLKIFGNYTHIVEGLIRAAYCTKYKNLNIWITSIKV